MHAYLATIDTENLIQSEISRPHRSLVERNAVALGQQARAARERLRASLDGLHELHSSDISIRTTFIGRKDLREARLTCDDETPWFWTM